MWLAQFITPKTNELSKDWADFHTFMFSRKFDDVVICGCLHSAEFMSFHWLGTEVGVRCVRDYFDLENDFYLRQA